MKQMFAPLVGGEIEVTGRDGAYVFVGIIRDCVLRKKGRRITEVFVHIEVMVVDNQPISSAMTWRPRTYVSHRIRMNRCRPSGGGWGVLIFERSEIDETVTLRPASQAVYGANFVRQLHRA